MAAPDPNKANQIFDHSMIRNTPARYAIVVDDLQWDDMHQVSAEHSRAHFTFLATAGDLHPTEAYYLHVFAYITLQSQIHALVNNSTFKILSF